jgi:molecular chaperone GrpE (heat shock protein)
MDLKTELAQKAREETRAKKRENDLADGLIHRQEDLEEVIWEHGLKPLRDELLAFDRKYTQAAQRGEPVDGKELARDFSQIMVRLRDALPADRKETKA